MTLRVFLVDPQTQVAKEIPFATGLPDDLDFARKQAKDVLRSHGYVIRSLGVGSGNTLLAYVVPETGNAMNGVPIAGWVYRKPLGRSRT